MIVEEVIDNDTVITSESAYGGTAWYSKTRKRGSDGNWGLAGKYAFRQFILNPAVECSLPEPVDRDQFKDQIEVTAGGCLRVRVDPGLDKSIVGRAEKGFYDVSDTRDVDGYTWYRLGHDQWVAGVADTVVYYPGIKWSMPEAVEKDCSKNQLHIGNVTLRIRKEPSTEADQMGMFESPDAYYNVEEIAKKEDYTWYKLGEYSWVAGVNGVTYYPAEEEEDVKELKSQIKELKATNKELAAENKELVSENKTIKDQLSSAQCKVEELNEKVTELNQTVIKNETKLKELKVHVDEMAKLF